MLVRSSLRGKVYALSEVAKHISLLKDFYGPFASLGPGMVGLEDKEDDRRADFWCDIA